MANSEFYQYLGYTLCAAMILFLAVTYWKSFTYNRLKKSLQEVAKKLYQHKPFLFRSAHGESLKNLEELIHLTNETSSLLKNWNQKAYAQKTSLLKLAAYIDDCKRRTALFLNDPQQSKESFAEDYKRERLGPFRGSCYFCSQPLLFPSLGKSKVGLMGEQKKVFSCTTCRHTLKKSHKVNTLCFFENDEKRVHWSQHKGYTPQVKYWNLNEAKAPSPPQKRPVVLKLVPRHKTKSNSITFES